ncbi:MAG: CoB--CoM heterodisulfide reductase iron-sulfur subunit B family protein [Desulfobacterales bacterium]|jgi:heterodisulfide reductase subunit B
MAFVYFPGCKIPYHLPGYDSATRAVLGAFEIDLITPDLTCCGYPIRHRNADAFVYSAARVMAIAQELGHPLLTPCMCCYGSLKHADHRLRNHPPLEKAVNALLAEEGLRWTSEIAVRHLLSVLHDDIGVDAISRRTATPIGPMTVAAHYGCHGIRPARIMAFDNPFSPVRFEKLIAATGATPIEWSQRTDCCGSPLWGRNDALALSMMTNKLRTARRAGADRIVTGCTYCQLHFGPVRRASAVDSDGPPAVTYPRLLGESMGIPPNLLGEGLPERPPDPDLQKPLAPPMTGASPLFSTREGTPEHG